MPEAGLRERIQGLGHRLEYQELVSDLTPNKRRKMNRDLESLLNEIIDLKKEQGQEFNRSLQPGLSPGEIEQLSEQLPFPIPMEIIKLYSWKNGYSMSIIYGSPDCSSILCFGGNPFISFEMAIQEYADLQDYFDSSHAEHDLKFDHSKIFPVGFSLAEGYSTFIVCGKHEFSIKERNPVVSIDEGDIDLTFYSMESMLMTMIEWEKSLSGKSMFDFDHESQRLAILERFNPGILAHYNYLL